MHEGPVEEEAAAGRRLVHWDWGRLLEEAGKAPKAWAEQRL